MSKKGTHFLRHTADIHTRPSQMVRLFDDRDLLPIARGATGGAEPAAPAADDEEVVFGTGLRLRDGWHPGCGAVGG